MGVEGGSWWVLVSVLPDGPGPVGSCSYLRPSTITDCLGVLLQVFSGLICPSSQDPAVTSTRQRWTVISEAARVSGLLFFTPWLLVAMLASPGIAT